MPLALPGHGSLGERMPVQSHRHGTRGDRQVSVVVIVKSLSTYRAA
jgi:hypothetical protein